MDEVLSDELLQEIFQRLPPSPSLTHLNNVTLVSKRWLSLYRHSRTSLSLHYSTARHPPLPTFSDFLSHHPFLSSLSLYLSCSSSSSPSSTRTLAAGLFLVIADCCPHLRSLSFLPYPVSVRSLGYLSRNCALLTSLAVSLSRPLEFGWVELFPCLKELSVSARSDLHHDTEDDFWRRGYVGSDQEEEPVRELGIESLCLTTIRCDDFGVSWLWRRCAKLKRLKLVACEGIGTGDGEENGHVWFERCLRGVEEVEITTCRSIVDWVLLKLAEHCEKLVSLLLYDGGSNKGLLQFLNNHRCNLESLNLRLPLDLSNDHLVALSGNCGSLVSFKVLSCCLVTGDGLKAFAMAIGNRLRELWLINCDVVNREPGLLTTLGQHLTQLSKLDLSYNEMLQDKELASMLVSCGWLVDLGLRGCKTLTSMAISAVSKSCKRLQSVDIRNCQLIVEKDVEFLLLNSPQLRRVMVEESKLSEVARKLVSVKDIEIVG